MFKYLINVIHDNFVNIFIRRKIHLINNFKINILIDNHVKFQKTFFSI